MFCNNHIYVIPIKMSYQSGQAGNRFQILSRLVQQNSSAKSSVSQVTLQAPAFHVVTHRSRWFSPQGKAAWSFWEKSSWKTETHFFMFTWEAACYFHSQPMSQTCFDISLQYVPIHICLYYAQQLLCALSVRGQACLQLWRSSLLFSLQIIFKYSHIA